MQRALLPPGKVRFSFLQKVTQVGTIFSASNTHQPKPSKQAKNLCEVIESAKLKVSITAQEVFDEQ